MFFLHRETKAKKYFWLKTMVASAVLASVITFTNGSTALADSADESTIYHVYLNGTYIGKVTDKKVIEQTITEGVNTSNHSNEFLNSKLGQQIEYIPEQVFGLSVNNNETIQTLKDSFHIQVEAAAILVDGEPIVYLENKDQAEEAIRNLKLQYVSEDQLKEYEERSGFDKNTMPPLGENETRILDIRLSKEVSIDTRTVEPEKIMSPQDAVTFLQKGALEEIKYVVQEGDVLESIAQKHGLKMEQLLALNPGVTETTSMQIGQELNVTVPKPFVDVIVEKESNLIEEVPYTQEIIEDSSLPKGQTITQQEGQNGSRSVTYLIFEQNGVTVKKEVTYEKILQQPIKNIVKKGTKVISSQGEGSFAWPAVGGYISSKMGQRWGRLHKGIDIARPSDRTIKAADNGVVVSAGWSGGYGNKIIIDHKNGFRTLYAHLSSIDVSVGQTVSKGSSIGIMGSTGNSTGTHLHFEVYKNGRLVDPLNYVNR
ncbi:M23 family metallopeptidase [Neobacillus sedimentimangrovi]|uniref:M23 family metallopeptidase n=1 Tax=Neobacillus sedimentimangrovi TaxID=2699460 RepID=A0ABS8QFP8_9BACI|nr:M23 family metallopeptidase [Neobacillus sedimentimangrovi]MCD4838020.1 M23 family metallopeptidase [Neobacillus sedimentimangrovi]